jgi:4-diphosphocytidyl-2-C-methyl-D-erythritol kinase
MRIIDQGSPLIVHAPAKLNLFLNVLGRRPDGYHDLDTLMVSVGIFDTLTFSRTDSPEIVLKCELSSQVDPQAVAPPLSMGEDNLVVRAARLFQRETAGTSGARIHLFKRIPMQAGMGGGSSDAAATLVALNRLWETGLTATELHRLAAQLGSDVNFFLDSHLLARCRGRGEQIEPLQLPRRLTFVIAKPTEGLSTATVFRGWGESGSTIQMDASEAAALIAHRPLPGLQDTLWNSLQEPSSRLCGAIKKTLRLLKSASGMPVLMTGSGSACFTLCRNLAHARNVCQRLRGQTKATLFIANSEA